MRNFCLYAQCKEDFAKRLWTDLQFLVVWRFFRMWALADGMQVPENMLRCICNNYDIEVRLHLHHCLMGVLEVISILASVLDSTLSLRIVFLLVFLVTLLLAHNMLLSKSKADTDSRPRSSHTALVTATALCSFLRHSAR